MTKTIKRIFILGFIWVIAGIVSFILKENQQVSTLLLAFGLLIESVAFLLFFWNKIKQK